MKISRSVLIHRLKTASYAIVTIVLASWVTNALNEDLMFKPVLRFLYPEAMQNYQHPFTDHSSLLLWSIPLSVGLLVLLLLSTMTVHQLKKRHFYRLSRQLAHPSLNILITWTPDADDMPVFIKSLQALPLHSLHVLCADEHELTALRNQPELAALQLHAHTIHPNHDLHKLYRQLNQVVPKIVKTARQGDALGFNLSRLPAELSSAATLVCLENQITLCYPDRDPPLKAHDVLCEMEETG